MIYIISYDITDDKKRNKVARILEKIGIRLQKSVFSLKCESYKLKRVLKQIEKIVDKTDSVIVFKLCKGCEKNSIYIGTAYMNIYIF